MKTIVDAFGDTLEVNYVVGESKLYLEITTKDGKFADMALRKDQVWELIVKLDDCVRSMPDA